MAKKQSRRSVSINRAVYDAAAARAAELGVTLSHFVTTALAEQGVTVEAGWHVDPVRREKVGKPGPTVYVAAGKPGPTVYVAAGKPGPTVYVAAATPEPPRVDRATLDMLAARRRIPGVPPGTACANCIDKPATHIGRVDTTDWRGPLCNACELPDDCKEIARFR
jgi:hypothetical protein